MNETKEEIEIYSTLDFDQFKNVGANRELKEKHILTLMDSISKKNLLKISPCIISKDMEVIDGQHRIEAAKRLNTPIYYIVDNGLDHDDIISLNNVKLGWSTLDFINFFAIKKNQKYMKLVKLIMNNPDLNLNGILCIISSDGKARVPIVKTGDLDILNISNFDTINNIIKDYSKIFLQTYYNSGFIKCIRKLYMKEFDFIYKHDVVMDKIKLHNLSLQNYCDKQNLIQGEMCFYRAIREIQETDFTSEPPANH